MLHNDYLHTEDLVCVYIKRNIKEKRKKKSPFNLSHFRSVHSFKCITEDKIPGNGGDNGPLPFFFLFFFLTVSLADSVANWPRSEILAIPQ